MFFVVACNDGTIACDTTHAGWVGVGSSGSKPVAFDYVANDVGGTGLMLRFQRTIFPKMVLCLSCIILSNLVGPKSRII